MGKEHKLTKHSQCSSSTILKFVIKFNSWRYKAKGSLYMQEYKNKIQI